MFDDLTWKEIIIVVFGVLLVLAASSLFSGLIMMLLWNWIAVSLFSVSPISFWMGWGIAFGLSFIGGFFRSRTTIKKD